MRGTLDHLDLRHALFVEDASLHVQELHPRHPAVLVQDPGGGVRGPDDDALLLSLADLVRARRHVVAAFQAGHVHLLGAQPPGGAGAVEGHVAAAQHDHPFADSHLVAQVHSAQEVGAHQDALTVGPRDAQLLSFVGAHCNHDRLVALLEERVQRFHPGPGHDNHSHSFDLADLALDHVPRQPVFGDAVAEHASGGGKRLEHGHLMPLEAQVVGRGETGGPGADNRHPLFGGIFGRGLVPPQTARMEMGSLTKPLRHSVSQG